MKRFFNYFFILTLISVVLVSCDEDDPLNFGGPEMTVFVTPADDAGVIEGSSGDQIEFDVSVTAEDGFNVFRLIEVVNGTETTLWERTRASGTQVTTFDTTFMYTLSSAFIDQNVSLELEAVDDASETESEVFTIEVTGTVNAYTTVLLVPPLANEESNTFFSAETGLAYSVNDVEAGTISSDQISFGYYYGQTNMATILSPAQFATTVGNANAQYTLSDWNVRNETQFVETDITPEQFMENDDDVSYIRDAFDNASDGTDNQLVTNLAKDDVIAFQLSEDDGGNYGLIRVTELLPGIESDKYIELEVLVVE